jgi:hypothetical protein
MIHNANIRPMYLSHFWRVSLRASSSKRAVRHYDPARTQPPSQFFNRRRPLHSYRDRD